MTTGAIYGNFKSRDDLFIALGLAYWKPISPRVKPDASFAAVMRAIADATIAALPDRSTVAVGRLTGMAYALSHEEMRAKIAEVTRHSYEIGEQWLLSVTKAHDLPMPADQLVRVIHALSEGLIFQRLLTPELIPDKVIRSAFLALAEGSKSP
jgi:AcrR family transcriptional regulator